MRLTVICVLLIATGVCAQAQDSAVPAAPAPIEPLVEAAAKPDLLPAAKTDRQPAAKFNPDPADLQKRIERLEKAAANPKLPTVNWTGQLQTDAIMFNQNSDSVRRFGDTPDGIAFRRARFGMFGDYDPVNYRIEFEFTGGKPQFLDVYSGIKDIPYVGYARVGHFFEPFSLEQVTSERYATFMERSIINQAFAPQRNLGAMMRNTAINDRITYATGLFATDSDAVGDSVGSPLGVALTSRVTALPWYESDGTQYLHLGAGYSMRQAHNGLVQFRAQPEMRIGATTPTTPFVADTKTIIADYSQLINCEWLLMDGPISLQSEWTLVPVHAAKGNLFFWGGYVETAWRITGEHRGYRKDNGTIERLIPKRDFISRGPGMFASGPGAIELAARVSYLDLDDGKVNGGRVTDLTLGINWHLNPYLRVTANYIHSSVTSGGVSNAVGLRSGWEF